MGSVWQMTKCSSNDGELKYGSEELALAVRNLSGLTWSSTNTAQKRADLSYTIHNLYLDSENLDIYWGTINGDKNRYKLRLRFYEDNRRRPCFRDQAEDERGHSEAEVRDQAGFRRVRCCRQLPAPSELVSNDPGSSSPSSVLSNSRCATARCPSPCTLRPGSLDQRGGQLRAGHLGPQCAHCAGVCGPVFGADGRSHLRFRETGHSRAEVHRSFSGLVQGTGPDFLGSVRLRLQICRRIARKGENFFRCRAALAQPEVLSAGPGTAEGSPPEQALDNLLSRAA